MYWPFVPCTTIGHLASPLSYCSGTEGLTWLECRAPGGKVQGGMAPIHTGVVFQFAQMLCRMRFWMRLTWRSHATDWAGPPDLIAGDCTPGALVRYAHSATSLALLAMTIAPPLPPLSSRGGSPATDVAISCRRLGSTA